MNIKFHLTVNSSGSVRTSKNRPDLKMDEITMLINLSLPDALFQKPQLSAAITIPDAAAMPQTIDAEVQDNVKAAIEQATGMEVKLSLVEPMQ